MSQNNNIHRRAFIANTAKLGVGLVVLPNLANSSVFENKLFEPNFKQLPLPYSYSSLEPNIDGATMEIHYTKHAAGYAKNLDDAFKAEYKKEGTVDLKTLLGDISSYSTKMRNNAGGHYNHELFWQCLTPQKFW